VSDLQELIAATCFKAYNEGIREEKLHIANILETELERIEQHPTMLDTIDGANFYQGIKKAQLIVKESV
jgi:hypothetical protein